MKIIDLAPGVIRDIREAVSLYPEVKRVIIFGSRVLGNAKPGSDVDLALIGDEITPEIVFGIREYLEEETLLPYFFDVIHFDTITNSALREHIVSYGKLIFER